MKHFKLILCLFFASASFAQDLKNLAPVHVQDVMLSPAAAKPGQTIEVKIRLAIDDTFHAYVDQYKLNLVEPKGFYLSGFDVKPTVKFSDPVTHREKIGTEHSAEVTTLLEISKDASSGQLPVKIDITYQACGPGFCLFPKHVFAETHVSVEAVDRPVTNTGSAAVAAVGTTADNSFANQLARGFWYSILVAFLAGVLTSFTPCIFPMIPITLAVLGTKEKDRTKLQSFVISLFYVLGIAVTYSCLGIFAAKTGAVFGSLLGNPYVVTAIALLFVAMALSMFGLFELQLPLAWQNKLTNSKQQKGMAGSFVSGLIAGVVAGPCVGPVLISILAYVAQTQDLATGFCLLFAFAVGFGQIFLVIGTFQNFWQKLPRSGPWMDQVKFIFGAVMIGMALYYIRPVASRVLFDSLVASALVVLGVYSGAFRKQKVMTVILLVSGVLFVAKAALPPATFAKFAPFMAGETAEIAKPAWVKYSDDVLKQAAADGKPVIIDYHAEWCLACTELEKYTFSKPEILAEGQKFVWVTFDATSPTPELEALQQKYGIGGLPFVMFLDRKGQWLKEQTLTGFEEAPLFMKRMVEAQK